MANLLRKTARAPRRPAIPMPVLLERLADAWPDAHCELDHKNAFELLVATILSAQCTDVRVNLTTPATRTTSSALSATR